MSELPELLEPPGSKPKCPNRDESPVVPIHCRARFNSKHVNPGRFPLSELIAMPDLIARLDFAGLDIHLAGFGSHCLIQGEPKLEAESELGGDLVDCLVTLQLVYFGAVLRRGARERPSCPGAQYTIN